ncbi:MAG TPA: FAD-binding oxidoreductase [Kiritimatiellia bacterium]|nr:FAD-binding oxidoreductase [Kiritimatiellia bacterium]
MIETLQPPPDDYLRDESRRTGAADRIAFPRTEADVTDALAEARRLQLPVTVQGARTGVTGGAVPEGGFVLNLSNMTAIRPDGDTLVVQPGATLDAIRAAVPAGRFFAPDPTESTASIGGMISCNASGALSFLHGPTRNHILGLRVATASGELLELHRGRDRADGLQVRLGSLSAELPPLPRPHVKNAAGYYVEPGMDLLDLFIGAEGTLGVVTEATLRLLPAPGAVWGLMAFLPDTTAVVGFVDALRADQRSGNRKQETGDREQGIGVRGPMSDQPPPTTNHQPPTMARLAAIEYFDSRCLDFLRAHAEGLATRGIAVPDLPPGAACVYAEWHAPDEAAAETAVLAAAERLPDFGADPDAVLLADNPRDMDKLKLFRHAAPELVNSVLDERRRIHPGLVKLGTDMSVPDDRLADVLALYEADLAASGLEHLIFGHIGANHLHVNILPRDPADYDAGRALYAKWAARIIAWGGSISAEHGIGKIKRDLFRQMAGDDALRRMRDLKRLLDPGFLLNPGNLIAPESPDT